MARAAMGVACWADRGLQTAPNKHSGQPGTSCIQLQTLSGSAGHATAQSVCLGCLPHLLAHKLPLDEVAVLEVAHGCRHERRLLVHVMPLPAPRAGAAAGRPAGQPARVEARLLLRLPGGQQWG